MQSYHICWGIKLPNHKDPVFWPLAILGGFYVSCVHFIICWIPGVVGWSYHGFLWWYSIPPTRVIWQPCSNYIKKSGFRSLFGQGVYFLGGYVFNISIWFCPFHLVSMIFCCRIAFWRVAATNSSLLFSPRYDFWGWIANLLSPYMYRNFVKFNSSTDHHFDGFWAPYDKFFWPQWMFQVSRGAPRCENPWVRKNS